MNLDFVIRPQRADHPHAVVALDAAMRTQGVTLALLEIGDDPLDAIRLYKRCAHKRRGPFGAHADNGLSLFYEMQL